MKVTGKLLIDLGFKGGKWFSQAINHFEENPTDNVEEIKAFCEQLVPVEILMLDEAKSYYINMEATNEDESRNIADTVEAMNKMMKHPLAVSGALMPDACPTGEWSMPVGSVIGIKNAIVPSMHSADVCCSVKVTFFGEGIDQKQLLDIAQDVTHFGYGENEKFKGYLPLSLVAKINDNPFTKEFIHQAYQAIGTQGDGNHFLFVGKSEATNEIALVTHHGSRSFGAKVYKKAQDIAKRQVKDVFKGHESLAWLDYSTELGQQYWEALQIIREWTKFNHEVIHTEITKRLGMDISDTETFWNEHNFVFKKEDIFYHAKGATPLLDEFLGDGASSLGLRIIPLNMAEPILLVTGEETENNLGFAPHGAGRNFGRGEFERRGNTVESLQKEIKGLDIRFYSGKPDASEFPSAYKNAKEVQSQIEHFGLGKIWDRIHPYGCIMAGKQEEPWKNKKYVAGYDPISSDSVAVYSIDENTIQVVKFDKYDK